MCMPNFLIYETAKLNYKWKFHYNTNFPLQCVRYCMVLHSTMMVYCYKNVKDNKKENGGNSITQSFSVKFLVGKFYTTTLLQLESMTCEKELKKL